MGMETCSQCYQCVGSLEWPPRETQHLRHRVRSRAVRQDRRSRRRGERPVAPAHGARPRRPAVHAAVCADQARQARCRAGRGAAGPVDRHRQPRVPGEHLARSLPGSTTPPGSSTNIYLVESDGLYARPTAVHRRPGRAPALPGADARGARVLPAHEFPAAPRALARLARGTRAVVAAFDLQARPGVRRHQVGDDHPQHRLPGRVRRGRRGRSRSRHRRLSTPPGRPQGRDHQRAQAGHPACRLRDHRQPHVRARNHHAALRHGDGAGAGGARQRGARHPERRRLRGMGSAPRPLPADPFHAAGNRAARPSSSAISCCARTSGPPTGACRCSAS